MNVNTVPARNASAALMKAAGICIKNGHSLERAQDLIQRWSEKVGGNFSPFEVKQAVNVAYKSVQKESDLNEMDVEKIVQKMNERYAFLTGPSKIIDIKEMTYQSKEMMRDRYADTAVHLGQDERAKPVTHFHAWFDSKSRRKHLDLTFQPGAGLIVNDRLNTWRGWGAAPKTGDITPWIKLLDYLFGPETAERRWIEQWIAYPLQHPGTKLSTAIVIWSRTQGVGKSLLGETVSRLYGAHGKTITAVELHHKFNTWSKDALFVLGEENAGSDRRADADRLKHLITGETVQVEQKFVDMKEQRNMMNFMFTSNHSDAFHLESRDRRFFVWGIDSDPLEQSFYQNFIQWRGSDSGLSSLVQHLLEVDLSGFDPNGRAPDTDAKYKMIEESRTDVERFVVDLLGDDCIDSHIGAEVVSLQDLVDRFRRDYMDVRMNVTAMARALRSQTAYEQNRISYGRSRLKVVSLRRHEYWATQDNADWAAEYAKGKKKLA